MGNNSSVCRGLWRRRHEAGSSTDPRPSSRNVHLLRVWAEIFQIRPGDENCVTVSWVRVSDHIAPVNVICCYDNAIETVLQVSAYNRHVDKILDVTIRQPGTAIKHGTECFIYWKDSQSNKYWGLNFTCPSDAKKFKDCCVSRRAGHVGGILRRASSTTSSIRIQPPQRVLSNASSRDSMCTSSTNADKSLTQSSIINVYFPSSAAAHDVSSLTEKSSTSRDYSSLPPISKVANRQKTCDRPNAYRGERSLSIGSTYDNISEGELLGTAAVCQRTETVNVSFDGVVNDTQRNVSQPMIMPTNDPEMNKKGSLQVVSPMSAEDELGNSNAGLILDCSKLLADLQAWRPPRDRYSTEIMSKPDYGQTSVHESESTEIIQTLSLTDRRETSSPLSTSKPPSGMMQSFRRLSSSSQRQTSSDVGFDVVRAEADLYAGAVISDDLETTAIQTTTTNADHLRDGVYSYRPAIGTERAPADGSESNDVINDFNAIVDDVNSMTDDDFTDDEEDDVRRDDDDAVLYANGVGLRPIGGDLANIARNKASITMAGFLSVKHWLTCKKHKLLLASRRKWTKCWVVLFGNRMLFSDQPDDHLLSTTLLKDPQANCIGFPVIMSHPLPEHPHKENVFAVNSSFGDTFLCQDQRRSRATAGGAAFESDAAASTVTLRGYELTTSIQNTVVRLVISPRCSQSNKSSALCTSEVDRWVGAVYSACAVTRACTLLYLQQQQQQLMDNDPLIGPTADSTELITQLLRDQIDACEDSIEQAMGVILCETVSESKHWFEKDATEDNKMKNMAELQLKQVTDSKSRQAIDRQLDQWNANVESFHLEVYQLRCYIAALHGLELPNPKTALANMSRASKETLRQLGVPACVSSLCALVSSRSRSSNTYNEAPGRRRRLSLSRLTLTSEAVGATISTTTAAILSSRSTSSINTANNSPSTHQSCSRCNSTGQMSLLSANSFNHKVERRLIRVTIPNDIIQNAVPVLVDVTEDMTVDELLQVVCNKRQLNAIDYFIQVRQNNSQLFTPDGNSAISTLTNCVAVQLSVKSLQRITLSKEVNDCKVEGFGLTVEAELADDDETESQLRIFVSDVIPDGIAQRAGVEVGDEIVLIDGRAVTCYDVTYIETLLRYRSAICLTLRSRRSAAARRLVRGDSYIDRLVCKPPPTQRWIDDNTLKTLMVPAPNNSDSIISLPTHCGADTTDTSCSLTSTVRVDSLLQAADQLTHFCHESHQYRQTADGNSLHNFGDVTSLEADGVSSTGSSIGELQRIQKVVNELVTTEKQYVKDLQCLLDRYLEPLKDETFLPVDYIEHLFINLVDINRFQKNFLNSLELCQCDSSGTATEQAIRVSLLSIGRLFDQSAGEFRQYSMFCAGYSRMHKLLSSSNAKLEQFLRVRNPKCQHSATLESYLIKPIQRILKYPLLLRQLIDLSTGFYEEHNQLSLALKRMQAVAEHVNEMQKIHEEFGEIFDQLSLEQRSINTACFEEMRLDISDLDHYGSVRWLNAPKSVTSCTKKGTRVVTELFLFTRYVVLIALETTKSTKRNMPSWLLPLLQNQLPAFHATTPSDNQQQQQLADVVRFATVIPINELLLQESSVNSDDFALTDFQTAGKTFRLIHCRSETQGRPQTTYILEASSTQSRQKFVKILSSMLRRRAGRQPNNATVTIPRCNSSNSCNRPISAPVTDYVQRQRRHSAASASTSTTSNSDVSGTGKATHKMPTQHVSNGGRRATRRLRLRRHSYSLT